MSSKPKEETQFQKDMKDECYCPWANCHCAYMESHFKQKKQIANANRILDRKSNQIVTQVNEEGSTYKHRVGLTATELKVRNSLKVIK